LGTEQLVRGKQLVNLFPDWSGERFPLYAMYPRRTFMPAKLQAFVEFCSASITSASRSR
jgi:DNA-binding transcriptional LysR family regulator